MMLLAAANNCDLGIDIEAIDNRTDRDAIVKRFFTHQEQLDYASNPEPDRPAAFLRAWTRKEAYLKARGDGLTIALNSFEVGVGRKATLIPVGQNEKWQIADLAVPGGYIGALVYEGCPRSLYYSPLLTTEQLW